MTEVKVVYAEMLSRGPEHWPFNAAPEWLMQEIRAGNVELSSRGARDYAVIDVTTPNGPKEATPGDFITFTNGELGVRKADAQ